MEPVRLLWKASALATSKTLLPLNQFSMCFFFLAKGCYGVLYYAGHGYEDGGKNYLLPVDSDLKYDRQDSLCAQEILETMQTCDTLLNVLIIDACRLR